MFRDHGCSRKTRLFGRSFRIIGGLLLAAGTVQGQFWDRLNNPKIKVTLKHPPALGLKISKIAFGPTRGDVTDQLVDALTQEFVTNGLEVIDRLHLQSILAEHNFSASGYVDPTTAAELGKILGPTALVFVNLQRNRIEQQHLRDPSVYKDRNGYPHIKYISRTQAFAKASIQTVDLATGRIFQATSVEASPLRENTAFDAFAEYPPESELGDQAMREIVLRIHQQFLPWSESRELYFFDDKDCDLKIAYSMLKAGDIESAGRQSETNLEGCKTLKKPTDRTLAHAYNNVGMSRFLLGDHDKALASFADAQRVKTMGITEDAMAEANRARALAASYQRFEERVALESSLGASGRSGALVRTPSAPGQPPAQAKGGGVPTGAPTIEQRLKQLDALYQQKLITKVEYDRKRAEILKEM
jgi:hypothetical protein